MKHIRFNFKYLLFALIAAMMPLAATAAGDSDYESDPEAKYLPAMIKVKSGDVDEAIASLTDQGVIVLRHRGDLLLTFIPQASLRSARKAKGVERVEYRKPRYNQPAMDVARQFFGAQRINDGVDLPQPYDGTGVVIGVCDIGMDTRHPTFRDADGECRIRRVVHYQEQAGLRDVYSTPQEIYNWRTDNDDEWHATHVVGIAAGSFRENNYQSLAPNADIVFTASQLSDVGLLAGVEDIIEYAKEVKKPCVINLSMGNNLGPHDGTSLFAQYLDRCADDAIICISAGNDGYVANGAGDTLSYLFSDTNKSVSVRGTNWDGFTNYGEIDVWGFDDTPFNITFVLDPDSPNIQPIISFDTLDLSSMSLEPGDDFVWRVSADKEDPDYNETFAEHYYEGYVQFTCGVDETNNRFRVIAEIDCNTDKTAPSSNNWAGYWPGVKVEGQPGVKVDIFGMGPRFFLRKATNGPAPDNKMSISDLATGHKTISVGQTCNKSTETKIDGSVLNTGYPAGEINPESSYGTLVDGRVMPLTCAPGAIVVSAMNGAFMEKYPESVSWVNDGWVVDGVPAYWVSCTGTSMSCPYVAGAVATWLQAYPKLKAQEAIATIQKSNSKDYPDPANPRHGQGWFNAYGALQEILSGSTVSADRVELDGVAIGYNHGFLTVNNYEGEISYAIYDLNGAKRGAGKVGTGVSILDLGGFAKGVYSVVFENGAGLRKVKKLFVN